MRVLAHHGKRHARHKANSASEDRQGSTRAKQTGSNANSITMNGNSPTTHDGSTISNVIKEAPWDTAANGSGHLAVASRRSATESGKRSSLRKRFEGQYKQKDAELILDLKNVRKKLNFNEHRAADNDERPRKRVKREVVKCQCHLAIWDNREGFIATEPIVKRTQLCSITTRDGPFGSKVVDIEMDEAFRVKATELFVPVATKGALKLAVGDKYFLETKIIPCDSEELWPPISILSKSEGSTIGSLGKRSIETVQGAMVSSYANLPQAPASNVPLSITFVQNGRTFKTKFGLEVSSTWAVPDILEARIRHEKNVSLSGSLFDPPLLEQKGTDSRDGNESRSFLTHMDPPPRKVVVSYRCDEMNSRISRNTSKIFRTASVDGFCCAACRKIECQTLTDLLFHLSTYHHKYKYTIEKEDKNPTSGALNGVVIKIEFADVEKKKPLKNVAKNPDKEFEWCAPKKPFDVGAYIEGDRSWSGHEYQKQGKGQKVATNGAVGSSAPVSQRAKGFLPAEDVQELPLPRRKRFNVIPSRSRNHTPFFRSVNHRQMRTDEDLLSESDCDMSDSWLREKHRERIFEKEDVDDIEKEFHARWDLHVMAEHFPSGRYISDSLVRFIRKNKSWLRGGDVSQELHKLMEELKDHGVVDELVLEGCLRILWNDEEKMRVERWTETDGVHINGLSDQTSNGVVKGIESRDTAGVSRPRVNGRFIKGNKVESEPDRSNDTERRNRSITNGVRVSGHKNAHGPIRPSEDDESSNCSTQTKGKQIHCGPGRLDGPARKGESLTNIKGHEYKPGLPSEHEQVTMDSTRIARPGVCVICSKIVARARQAIACNGPVSLPFFYYPHPWGFDQSLRSSQNCATPGTIYHLACVGQRERSEEWLCKACFARDVEIKNLDRHLPDAPVFDALKQP